MCHGQYNCFSDGSVFKDYWSIIISLFALTVSIIALFLNHRISFKIGYIDKIFFDQPNYSNGQGNYASQTNKSSDVKFPSQNPKNEEEKILDSWLNSKKEALIKANGPPDAVSSDGKGGEIYSYGITQRTVLSPGISTSYHSDNPYVFEKDVTFYDPAITQVNSRSRMFFINEEGIIYYWLIKSK
jgi:hypothetical protein